MSGYTKKARKGLQSVSDSDDSEPTPVIVFTPDDDNTDWQKDGE